MRHPLVTTSDIYITIEMTFYRKVLSFKTLNKLIFFQTNEATVPGNKDMISPSDIASVTSSCSNNMMGYDIRLESFENKQIIQLVYYYLV